jgi:hypothetical protein
MKPLNGISRFLLAASPAMAAALLVAGMPARAQAQAPAQEDHSHHHHAGPVAMDAEGKRLESYDVRHEMSPEDLAALRRKVALYRGMTDREVEMNMNGMGPDYEWYVSGPKLRGSVGLLVLSHGVGANSDRVLHDAYLKIADKRPTAIGFGMAMMGSAHLQSAVDDLVAHGAKTIVLLDEGTTTKYNTLTRHWQYIFGMYPEASYMDVPKVTAPGVRFVWAGHFDDSTLITEILYDHAKEVSKDPAKELLIIVGHGPEDAEDNDPDLKVLQPHVERLKARHEFADVRMINIQDDAIKPVRESNVRKLRGWIQQADKQGLGVLVVAISAASYGVQMHIKQDLRGLKYSFAEKGLAESPKFIQWAEGEVEQAVAQAGAPGPKAPARDTARPGG